MKRPFLSAIGAAILLAALASYPLISRPGSVTRFDTNDGKFSVWNVAWVAHALTDSSARLFDANIFHPHTGTLAYSEANLVAGVMAIPPYVLTGDPVAAYNAVVFVVLVLAFVTMWALVRRLTGDPLVALVPAAGFAMCTYVSAHTAHIQLLMIFVLPLALLDLHRFVEQPTIRRAAGVGLSLALAGLACGYYGIFGGLMVGLGLVWFARGQPQPRRYWTGIAIAVVVGGALVAPALRPYVELRRESGFKSVFNEPEARMYAANGYSYLRSGSIAHQALQREAPAWLQDGLQQRNREVLFPGFVIAGLAIFGLIGGAAGRGPISRRVLGFYAVLTTLAVWASFGPDGLLYSWLAEWVPMMTFLRTPGRIGIIALLGLGVLAGAGLTLIASRPRGRWLVVSLLLLTTAELKAAWPLVDVPPVPAVYRHLATLPRAGVVELHFAYRRNDEHQHARYMFWSMWHWQPLLNGYSDYIPPDFYQIAIPVNYFPDPESFRILRERDVRYVLVHLDGYTEGPIRDSMLARFPPYADNLTLLLEAENSRLYEIVRWP